MHHGTHGGEHQEHAQHSATSADSEGHAAHDRHAGHNVAMFRDKFWITLLLTIPTVIWSDMVQHAFHYAAPAFPGSAYIPAVFGTTVFVYGGWVFLASAMREIRNRVPGMMTLISLAIGVAFVFSLAVTLGYPGEALWWELATLVAIMLLVHRLGRRGGALR